MFMQVPKSFSTFPVKNKKPLVSWGEYIERLPTEIDLRDWKLNFGEYQKGIVTGPISKILVLDDDGGLNLEKYPIPQTWTVQTPRGGTHYYFRWIESLSKKVTTRTEILGKVDIRGDGGFVVFYGFQKPYQMLPLAKPPQWLIDLLPDKVSLNGDSLTEGKERLNSLSAQSSKSHIQELLDGIKLGNRNDSFTRIAGSLRGRGYSSADIFGILSPKASETGFGLNELSIICDSVARYEPNVKIDESIASSIDEFLKDQQEVEWICEGMIAKKSIGFIAGLPETMKTFICMNFAVESALGGMWLNKFKVKKSKVLYIDQERFKGETQRRFKAIIAGKGLTGKDLKDSLFIKCGSTTRLNLQESFNAFRKQLNELKPDLVIIDSLATIHTAEENNRQSIQEVLEKVKELRNEIGCSFLFLCHENKHAFDKESGEPSISQMAGSIAIPAAAEFVFTVRRHDSESSMVYQTKNTLAPSISPFLVKIVDLIIDRSKIAIIGY